jgi:catechol 2,3-dioxygenase-like lactoylglutathione lyase family enzyme
MPDFDKLVHAYDTGQITRRELLATLAALAASGAAAHAGGASPSPPPPIGTVKQLNHVTVFVPNVAKAVAFYQDLLGLPVLTPQDPGVNLAAGNGFLGIYPARAGATTGTIDHVCFGLENFDADAVLAALKSRGIAASIRMRGDTKELYFTDPDGIRVQLQDARYIGGVGVLGDRRPK